MRRLSPLFWQLTQDACHKAFWTKAALRTFLRTHRITENHLNSWQAGESKKQYIARLFQDLANPNKNHDNIVFDIALSLSEMTSFPDLENYENSSDLLKKANISIPRLRDEVNKIRMTKEDEERKIQRRKEEEERRIENIAKQESINSLKNKLNELIPKQGTQQAGYEFEKWFYELALYFDIESASSFKNGREQIDGAITIDGTTFLVETKFTLSKTESPAIRDFLGKVVEKAENTMGIFVSMSGYTEDAIKTASRDRTPLLLLDYSHIVGPVLMGTMSLPDVIRRIKRHASQTGKAFLAPCNFSK